MEIILSGEFARLFYSIGTALVILIVWRGYYHDLFSVAYAQLLVIVFVGYSTAFLWFKYVNGEVAEHTQTEKWYPIIASIHGTLSLTVIVHAAIVFYFAGRTQNYFRAHPRMSLFLVLHWVLALFSGFPL